MCNECVINSAAAQKHKNQQRAVLQPVVTCGWSASYSFSKEVSSTKPRPALRSYTFKHDLMPDEALAAMRHDDALKASIRTAVNSFDELVSKYRANIKSGPSHDTGDDIAGTQLIGQEAEA